MITNLSPKVLSIEHSNMKYTIDKCENYALLSLLEEKLDTRNAPNLKSEFVLMNNEGFQNIILNLETTQYIDSSGLSAILVANRLCSNQNGMFVLCGLNSNVLKMVEISQLDKVLNIATSQQQAIDMINGNPEPKKVTQIAYSLEMDDDDDIADDDDDFDSEFEDDFDDDDFDDSDLDEDDDKDEKEDAEDEDDEDDDFDDDLDDFEDDFEEEDDLDF